MKQTLAEAIVFRAPPGSQAAVRAAADKEAIKPSEFLRRVIAEATKRAAPAALTIHDGPSSLIAA